MHSSYLNFPKSFFSYLWYKLSKAKYGLIVVAPTPKIVANECVSKASPVCTFIETYPLNFFLIKCLLIAPTHKSIGIAIFSSDTAISVNTSCVAPCLTAISDSFIILSKDSTKELSCKKVQSIVFEFSPKNLINFENCEFDKIGLSKT